jgi:hypothetical protein
MDHQAHYSSYHKSIILTMTPFFILPPLLFNTTYLIHVVTLRLWIDDPSMNGTMTPLDPTHDLVQWTRVEERGSDPELCDYGIRV